MPNQFPVSAGAEPTLLERALGYSREVKVTLSPGREETTIERFFPPETGACIEWLTKRRPDKWRR